MQRHGFDGNTDLYQAKTQENKMLLLYSSVNNTGYFHLHTGKICIKELKSINCKLSLTKYRIAIFCDSEFFHGKDWDVLKVQLQKSKNSEFWINKISNNMKRDREINKELLFMGWKVIRFWGKEIMKNTDECIRVIEEAIFESKVEDNI